MDHQSLVPIAQRAVLQVLNYNFLSAENGCGLPALDQQTRERISADIQKNLPLVAHAVDKHKAYLEIVCDAALPVADKYNINKRWFYTAVQGMTSMDLVPSLYENVEAPIRLSISDMQKDDGTASFEGQEMDHKEEGAQPDPLITNVAVPPKNNRRNWSEAEIRRLIDLQIAGKTLPAIADQMERSFFSVQAQWRKVSKPESTWKDYLESKMIAVDAEQGKKAEQASEGDDSDESEEGDEGEEADEADEQAQLPDQATDATTVANASDVPDPKRPWTDPDIRELIRFKIGGLSTAAVAQRMRRPHRSVHCTWLNVMTNTGSRWFQYMNKQFRAKEKREKQEKASQVAIGADSDATGQSGSTQLLGKRKRAPSSIATEATEANAGTDEGNAAQPPTSELS